SEPSKGYPLVATHRRDATHSPAAKHSSTAFRRPALPHPRGLAGFRLSGDANALYINNGRYDNSAGLSRASIPRTDPHLPRWLRNSLSNGGAKGRGTSPPEAEAAMAAEVEASGGGKDERHGLPQ